MNTLESLGITIPIVQAPMAGISTPAMAAAVSNAGGLGSIALGATDAIAARFLIAETRALTARPINVNLFVHDEPKADTERDQIWFNAMRPMFHSYGMSPPSALRNIYKSFSADDDMLSMLLEVVPDVVSFHFGIPSADRIRSLQSSGCLLMATATNIAEAEAIENAGIAVIVAQGWEAGGHRGVFDPTGRDDQYSTLTLTRLLVARSKLPIISAGGIMDGAGIKAALAHGAHAAQLGTAFIDCPESNADEAYRVSLKSSSAAHTIMTKAISGRLARCLPNRFTHWGASAPADIPDYPLAYDAGKALNAAAVTYGETGYGAQWAGQGAPLTRSMGAAELVNVLWQEVAENSYS